MNTNKQITVTAPLLPDLEEFQTMLKEIWESKWITNNGQFHRQLEKALAEYLGVEYISVFRSNQRRSDHHSVFVCGYIALHLVERIDSGVCGH